jgi:RNA polymerase sigma factor (sigma-70 family)
MASVGDLLEPGEIAHLRLVAKWQRRPVQGVVIDEVRRQFGSSCRRGYTPKINRTKWLVDVAPPVSDDEPVLDRLVHAERVQRLRRAVEGLPHRQRQAIQLQLAGYGLKAIGTSMGVSTHTVEHHLRRGRALLACALAT